MRWCSGDGTRDDDVQQQCQHDFPPLLQQPPGKPREQPGTQHMEADRHRPGHDRSIVAGQPVEGGKEEPGPWWMIRVELPRAAAGL